MCTIYYVAIFECRMPTPSLWIFLKDLSVFKITEKCSIHNHFVILYVLLSNTVFAKTF